MDNSFSLITKGRFKMQNRKIEVKVVLSLDKKAQIRMDHSNEKFENVAQTYAPVTGRVLRTSGTVGWCDGAG